jgi:hypothetical protein
MTMRSNIARVPGEIVEILGVREPPRHVICECPVHALWWIT